MNYSRESSDLERLVEETDDQSDEDTEKKNSSRSDGEQIVQVRVRSIDPVAMYPEAFRITYVFN